MDKPKLITTVLTEFLKDEYNNSKIFQQIFKTYDDFELAMKDEIIRCGHCNSIVFKSCDLRCDCAYKETLKNK